MAHQRVASVHSSGIAGRDDLHVRQRAGDRDVLLRMVGAAESRIDDAGAHADDGHRQVLVAEIVAHHLERPIERERRDRVGERLAALEREAGADADHALLGDADIDEALGILLAEFRHAAGRRDVGDDDVDVGIGGRRLVERLGEGVSHDAAPPSSVTACCVFVLAGRAVVPDRHVLHVADALALGGLGHDHQRLRAARAFVTASKMAAESWPSISTVSQPNACELGGQRIERRMGLGRAAEALEIVVVDEGDDVGEPERGRHQHGLPGRAFLHLAVAQHGVDDAVGLPAALGERHADDHRQAVAERAGRGLDARIAVVGMAAEPAIRRAIGVEVGSRSGRRWSSRITYWIMQPWPFDIRKVSGEVPS